MIRSTAVLKIRLSDKISLGIFLGSQRLEGHAGRSIINDTIRVFRVRI